VPSRPRVLNVNAHVEMIPRSHEARRASVLSTEAELVARKQPDLGLVGTVSFNFRRLCHGQRDQDGAWPQRYVLAEEMPAAARRGRPCGVRGDACVMRYELLPSIGQIGCPPTHLGWCSQAPPIQKSGVRQLHDRTTPTDVNRPLLHPNATTTPPRREVRRTEG
jgi:hypothetical protein